MQKWNQRVRLSIHMIRTGWSFTRKEYLVNALKGLEEVALADLDQDEKDKVIKYLDKSDPENPLAKSVRDLVSSSKLVPMSEPGWYTKVKISFRDFYAKIVSYKYFRSAMRWGQFVVDAPLAPTSLITDLRHNRRKGPL